MLRIAFMESWTCMKLNLKVWSFCANSRQNEDPFIFCKIYHNVYFTELLFFNFTNIKYMCLYF